MQFGDESNGFSFWGPAKVGQPQDVLQGQRQAWVLIFRPGREDEGVYTLQGAPREPNSPTSFVLAFEHTDDAMQFADSLHQQGFDVATPLPWSADDLVYFCEGAGYEVSLVPAGAQITPPPMHDLSHNHGNAAGDRFNRPRFDNNPGFGGGEPNFFNRGPGFGGGGDPRFGQGGPGFGGDPRFNADANFNPHGYGYGDRNGMMGPPGDPGRNYPGLDPSRPDAFATERSRLEALFPQDPDDCKVDGADDDCLHTDDDA